MQTVFEHLSANGRHATRQLGALLRAVAHNHHLAEFVGIVDELNVDSLRVVIDVNFLRAIAHILDAQRQRQLGLSHQSEVTICIRHGTSLLARLWYQCGTN